jgi:hypothetical protein
LAEKDTVGPGTLKNSSYNSQNFNLSDGKIAFTSYADALWWGVSNIETFVSE